MYLSFLFLCACISIQSVSSQAIAAWNSGIGDQVIYQNISSGDLFYTTNTGGGIGTSGFTALAKLPLSTPPRAGTQLAGTGYQDQGGINAQIYYTSNGEDIIEVEVRCELPGCNCTLQRSNTISSEVTSGVMNGTGLAATLRSETDGYRVFYHDATGSTRQIRYYYPNVTWGPGVSVINATNESLTAIATDGSKNLTAYGIGSAGNIRASTRADDETWEISGLILAQNLSSWDPSNVTIAATVGATNTSKSLFYIGFDRAIHQIETSDNWQTMTAPSSPSLDAFPLADVPNSQFGLSVSSGTSCFYYFSGGMIMKASLDHGVWQKAVSIFDTSTVPLTTASRKPNSGIKMGVGIGLGLGIPSILALGAVFYTIMKRRKGPGVVRMVETSPLPLPVVPTPPTPGPPVPEKNLYEAYGKEIMIHEMADDRRHELSGRRPSWEPKDEKGLMSWV